MRFWQFLNNGTNKLERLLRTVIAKQETIMAALDDLKDVVAEIAADAVAEHDEIMVALDHIVKETNNDPEIVALVDSLRASHTSFADNLKVLKDKVDEVMASGGPTP